MYLFLNNSMKTKFIHILSSQIFGSKKSEAIDKTTSFTDILLLINLIKNIRLNENIE